MKPYIYLLLFLSIFTRPHLFCAQRATRTVGDLVHRVTQSYTTDAFARQIIAVYPERQHELECACNFFETTPGFLIVLKHIARSHSTSSVKGYWYELEKALALHRKYKSDKQQKIILSFGTIIQSPTGHEQREFDIIAWINNRKRLYECKNRQWYSNRVQLEAQFTDQQRIVMALAEQKNKVEYVVASKQPIPPQWQRFFEEHAIKTELD